MKKWVQTDDLKVICDNLILEIGDVVDYHDEAGRNGEDLYKGKWKALGADSEGHLLIVSDENVTTHTFNAVRTLKGAQEAYVNGVQTLNKICEVYGKGKGAVGARSITVDDVDRITGFDKTTYPNYGKEIMCINKEGNTFIWYDGEKFHETVMPKKVISTNTYYSYNVCKDTKITKESKVYGTLFGKNSNPYWLASSSVGATALGYGYGIREVYEDDIDDYALWSSFGLIASPTRGVRVIVTFN